MPCTFIYPSGKLSQNCGFSALSVQSVHWLQCRNRRDSSTNWDSWSLVLQNDILCLISHCDRSTTGILQYFFSYTVPLRSAICVEHFYHHLNCTVYNSCELWIYWRNHEARSLKVPHLKILQLLPMLPLQQYGVTIFSRVLHPHPPPPPPPPKKKNNIRRTPRSPTIESLRRRCRWLKTVKLE